MRETPPGGIHTIDRLTDGKVSFFAIKLRWRERFANRPTVANRRISLSLEGLSGQRRKPWNPPRDLSAENFVVRAETCSQGRFFVDQHKKMKQQPDKSTVCKERHVSKNQGLTQNGAHDRDVHRISDKAIQPGDNQMAGREYRRRRARTLHGESDKRI